MDPLAALAAFGTQAITGFWLSLTVTKNVVELLPQEFVAVTVTGVTPLKKVNGEVITVVPILYTSVGAGDPVTVTFGPNDTDDALQLLASVLALILVASIVGAWFTVIFITAAELPHTAVTV